jgi:hypothetical protein
MWFWLFAVAVLVVLFGAAISSAFRWIGRLALSVVLAIMIAVPTGTLLMQQDEDEVAMALLLAVLLTVAIFWLTKPRLPKPARAPLKPANAGAPTLKRAAFRRTYAGDQIAQVWDRLEDEAPHQAARISIARRSSERSRQALKARHLEFSAHSTLVMLERRIPELIDSELKFAAEQPSRAGMKIIDELVDLLERFAADCERQLSSDHRLGAPETRLLRQHIERYLDRDGDRPLNP